MKNKTNKLKIRSSGFVLLFAVVFSAILLAVGLGVANIALKEINFSTSARATNDAFLAADTGVECALYNDKEGSLSFVDIAAGGSGFVGCLGDEEIPLEVVVSGDIVDIWRFIIRPNMPDSTQNHCSIVTVTKEDNTYYTGTNIVSKGYNVGDDECGSDNLNRIERELNVRYFSDSSYANYRYIKFNVTTTKTEPTSGCTQISELVLLSNGSPVSWPVGTVATHPLAGSYNAGEGPGRAIDGNLGTKLCDISTSGGSNNPMTLIIDTISSIAFNGYKYGTANDAPGRDPVSWTVEGSDDGSVWTIVDTRNNETITNTRNTYTSNYNF